MATEFDDVSSLKLLKEIEIKAYDFDLTAVLDYADVEKRFDIYLAHTLGKNPIYLSCIYNGVYEFERIGRVDGDRFYFLLHYAWHLDSTPKDYKKVYQTLIGFITTGPTYRMQRIVNTLKTVAKNAAFDPNALFANDTLPLWKGNRVYWQALFKSNRNSEALWREMTDDHDLAEELVDMIEKGLLFFHPYLPMTPVKKWTMLFYLESQLELGTKSSKGRGGNGNIGVTFGSQLSSLPENDSSVSSSTQTHRYTLSFWQDSAKRHQPECSYCDDEGLFGKTGKTQVQRV